jgi:hypothetical protein
MSKRRRLKNVISQGEKFNVFYSVIWNTIQDNAITFLSSISAQYTTLLHCTKDIEIEV